MEARYAGDARNPRWTSEWHMKQTFGQTYPENGVKLPLTVNPLQQEGGRCHATILVDPKRLIIPDNVARRDVEVVLHRHGKRVTKQLVEIVDPLPEVFDEHLLWFLAPGLAFMSQPDDQWPEEWRTSHIPKVTLQTHGGVTCAVLLGECPSKSLVQHGQADLIEIDFQHGECAQQANMMVKVRDAYIERVRSTGRTNDEKFPEA